jgi:hypothetical protein
MMLFLFAAALGGLLASAKPSLIHYEKRNVDVNGKCVLANCCSRPNSLYIALNSNWDAAYDKAKAALAAYTLADKVNITTGVGWEAGPCVGNIAAVKSTIISTCPEILKHPRMTKVSLVSAFKTPHSVSVSLPKLVHSLRASMRRLLSTEN